MKTVQLHMEAHGMLFAATEVTKNGSHRLLSLSHSVFYFSVASSDFNCILEFKCYSYRTHAWPHLLGESQVTH